MRLEMELVREILVALEKREELGLVLATNLRVGGSFTDDQLKYHAQLLEEAGYIAGAPWYIEGTFLYDFHIERLTFKGHDFVSNAESNGVWSSALEKVKRTGGSVSLNVFSELLGSFAKGLVGLAT